MCRGYWILEGDPIIVDGVDVRLRLEDVPNWVGDKKNAVASKQEFYDCIDFWWGTILGQLVAGFGIRNSRMRIEVRGSISIFSQDRGKGEDESPLFSRMRIRMRMSSNFFRGSSRGSRIPRSLNQSSRNP